MYPALDLEHLLRAIMDNRYAKHNCAYAIQIITLNLVEATNGSSHFECIATSAFVSSGRSRLTRPAWRRIRPFLHKENVMRRQMMVIVTVALAGSLLTTDAQARGGGSS
jgi:hypothetical protein